MVFRQNPAFQDTDGLTNPQGGPTDTYGSYHTLANENYPTRSVSTVSPVSRGDYAVGRVNPGFFNDNGDTGVHVYPERRDGRSSNNNTGPITRPGGKMSSHKNYSPTEDRELPGCYTPVNSHRKLLRYQKHPPNSIQYKIEPEMFFRKIIVNKILFPHSTMKNIHKKRIVIAWKDSIDWLIEYIIRNVSMRG